VVEVAVGKERARVVGAVRVGAPVTSPAPDLVATVSARSVGIQNRMSPGSVALTGTAPSAGRR
jgi:hypothetical protein